jgi:ABC-type branched-subunit amino acid transport system substrate-binding protein
VVLRLRDDAGQAERTAKNMQGLLDEGVWLFSGFHGAPGVEAVLGLLDSSGAVMVGAATGAESLREPPRKGLFNLRASIADEAAAIIYQLDSIGATRVATIAQNDATGIAGLSGMNAELARVSQRAVAVERLDLPVRAAPSAAAVRHVCAEQPQAVLLALDPANALRALQQAAEQKCRVQFYVLSEAGAALAPLAASQPAVAGVIATQVVPPPASAAHPLATGLRRQLVGEEAAHPSYPALEGYLYARVISEALQACARELTRKCIVDTLEARPRDVAGFQLAFSPSSRRGSRFVDLTMIRSDGAFSR